MTANDYQLQIERLVDGELPLEEEAKLLQVLEVQPTGWKQLALAFLEDRTFCASLADNVGCTSHPESQTTPATQNVSQSHPTARFWNSMPTRICAACAVLLAAFLSGRFSATAGRNATPDPIVAGSSPSPVVEATENNIPDVSDELPPPIEFISLNVGADGEEVQTVEVPLLPWDQLSGSAEVEELNEAPSLIPAELREFLARRGQSVRESLDYYQFELSDGRVGVIPVSSVEIEASAIPLIQ